MAEISETTSAAINPSPRKFVAFGRLLGGLVLVLAGALGLHFSNNTDVTAFASVATVAGAVLNCWGFIGTVLHRDATREDCFWAIAFFLLFCAVFAGNVYFNNYDYGVPFVGLEVSITGVALVFASIVAIVTRVLSRRNVALTIQERRLRMLIAGLIAMPLAWVIIRPPLTAQFHVRKLQSGFYGVYASFPVDRKIIEILKKQPKWCVRWALLDGLNNFNLLKVDRILTLLHSSR